MRLGWKNSRICLAIGTALEERFHPPSPTRVLAVAEESFLKREGPKNRIPRLM